MAGSANVGGLPVGMTLALLVFAIVSCLIFVYHELHYSKQLSPPTNSKLHQLHQLKYTLEEPLPAIRPSSNIDANNKDNNNNYKATVDSPPEQKLEVPNDDGKQVKSHKPESEKRGELVCNGKSVDSEIIYWKAVPGDDEYESPITPHHGDHHDKYLSFEYDNGGWNNVRMSLECLIVVAHATGRTLVIPPQQHLYLLGKTHQDPHDTKPHDEMGFEDFFDIAHLQSHKGFHSITMKEFLINEGSTGGLNPQKMALPKNDTNLWGKSLWYYLNHVADETPAWAGKFIAFPDRPGDFTLSEHHHPHMKQRLKSFANNREAVYYDDKLQKAHHIHIRGDDHYRVLQHHYAFAFFADPKMQSFYKRFIRDYMRYKDYIQCHGHDLLQLVREDARKENPASNGEFYAMHIRRGDLQFKEVKIGAPEIVKNLNFSGPDGKPLIPPGSLLYVSTDDPEGLCTGCMAQRKPCTEFTSPKPEGCPEDTSWDAFRKAGWKVRFLKDYLEMGHLKGVNGNLHGMIESIVCSRAKVFAGTFFSTFTGYIHRLRGFHGLGEATYYHHHKYAHRLQLEQSIGSGFSREWRYGWTDDGGEPI